MGPAWDSDTHVSGSDVSEEWGHTDQGTVRLLVGEHGALTRGSFLRRVALGAGATSAVTVAVLGLPRLATSTPSPQQDRAILDFLLTLERTQAGFYAEAMRRGSLSGELRQFVEVVGGHERAHVERLAGELGSAAGPEPELDLDAATADAERVRATALALEDIALDGFNGQIPNLTSDGLSTVLQIASVEARHVGWIRDLAASVPAPDAADALPTEQQVRTALRDTRIVTKDGP
jgi:hypothetical protein